MTRLVFFGYARKSRIDPKDRQEVESTDRQITRLRAWAAEQGVELELFAEPDGRRSGGSIDHRPAYQEMLARVRTARPGEIVGIVATDLDRTGRLERDMHDLFDEVVSRGLRLVVLDDPRLNLESTDGRFMAGMQVLLAARERRKAGDRVRAAIHDRRARGLHVGMAPYGYRYVETTTESGHKLKTLDPNPDEAERLLAIFDKYLTGEGIDGVARWCNALGWTTRRGGMWTAVSINELLIHVRTYRGFVLTRDDRQRVSQLAVGRHPPIIDEQLAQAIEAAKRRRGNERRAGRHAEQPYPLVHLAVCAECGSNIVGATLNIQNGKPLDAPRYFYRCKKDRGLCDTRRMPALPLEGQVWAILDQFRADLHDAASRDQRATLRPERPRPLPEPSAAGAIRAEMERLTTIYQKGRISEERYDREYAALEDRLTAATATITTIGSAVDPLGLRAVERMMAGFDEAWKQGDRRKLREIAREMVEQVAIYRGVVVKVRLIPELEMLAELE